jgi:hypothetical protein
MFSSVRKVVVRRAFAKAASLLLDRTLYYMNRRFWATVTNTFAGHLYQVPEPAKIPILVGCATIFARSSLA